MTGIVWIGSGPAPEEIRVSAMGGLREAGSVQEALAAGGSVPLEVVLVSVDLPGADEAVRAIREAHPDAQILVVTNGGIPAPVAAALLAGAAGVIDLAADPALLGRGLHDAWMDFMRSSGERELLLRLRDLNEEFLRNVVALEKRNLELTDQLQETARMSDFLLSETGETRERVLVVDDEEMICDLVNMTLQDSYEVETVLDGKAAEAALAVKPAHLVLTDKNLPGMSGLDVIRVAKASNPDTDVILMTGYASTESAIEALNLGASGYLEKPFDLPALVAKVEEVLGKQRERLRKRHYLRTIKQRNQAFLERYGSIRTDIEAWLAIKPKKSGEAG